MMGFELKQLRQRAGLSQSQLAVLLDVSKTSVTGWEVGRHPINRITEIAARHVLAEIAERRPSTIPPPVKRPGWQRRLRKWLLERV